MGAYPSVAANAATALPTGANGKVPSANISLKDLLAGVNAANTTTYISMKNLKDNTVPIWSVSGSGSGATITVTTVSSLVGAGDFSLKSLSNYYWAKPDPVTICYVSPGTYTVNRPNYNTTLPIPTGLKIVSVQGAGGGGASGGGVGTGGGGGGGSGTSVASTTLIPYNTNSTVSITVGAGGTGGAASGNNAGGNGGSSSVTVVTSGTTYTISSPGGSGADISVYTNLGGPGGAAGGSGTSTNITITQTLLGYAGARGTAGSGGAGGLGGDAANYTGMMDGWGYLGNSTNLYSDYNTGTVGQYMYAPPGASVVGGGTVTYPPLKTAFPRNYGSGGVGGTAEVNFNTGPFRTAGTAGLAGGVSIKWYYT